MRWDLGEGGSDILEAFGHPYKTVGAKGGDETGVCLVLLAEEYLVVTGKQSMRDMTSQPAAESTILSMQGSGNSSLGQALFKMVKSMHMRNLPFFFFIMTMFASQTG